MPRAVLKNGVIVPLEPLPAEWADGQELVVEPAEPEPATPEEIDAWFRELEAECADSTPEEEALIQEGIDAHRRAAKEWMRRRMGLPE
jgi:hypothetical protein